MSLRSEQTLSGPDGPFGLALDESMVWTLDVGSVPRELVRLSRADGLIQAQAQLEGANPTALAVLANGDLGIGSDSGVLRIGNSGSTVVDQGLAVYGLAAAGSSVWTSENEHLVRRDANLVVVAREAPAGGYRPGQIAVVGSWLFMRSSLTERGTLRVRDLSQPGLPLLGAVSLGTTDANMGIASYGGRLFALTIRTFEPPRLLEYQVE